jgi:hypothetical protein
VAQNELRRSKSKKHRFSRSCGWQRDLVEFSVR